MNRLVFILTMLGGAFAATSSAQELDPPNVNSELSVQSSEAGVFSVYAEPALRPMRLNKMHYWTLRLTDADNNIVNGAEIGVDGGMPGHGHGLPTSPRVSPGDVPGEYLLKGLRFNMSGVWELKLDIHHGERSDQLQFRFVVEDATGR